MMRQRFGLVFGALAAVWASSSPPGGLRATFYSNAVLAHPETATNTTVQSLQLAFTQATPPPGGSLALFSARFDATLTAPAAGSYEFRLETNGAVRLWLDDHILVDSSCHTHPSLPTRGKLQDTVYCGEWATPVDHAQRSYAARDNVTHHIEAGLHLRLEWLHYGGGPASLSLLWRAGVPSLSLPQTGGPAFAPVPPAAFSTAVADAELWRQQLQAGLSRGWNTWMRASASRHVHLPSAFGFELTLFDSVSNTTFEFGLVDKCKGADANSCRVRPGHHAFNGSVTSWVQRVAWAADGTPTLNVTVASAHTLENSGDGMVMLLMPSAPSASLWAVVTPSFFFDCGIAAGGPSRARDASTGDGQSRGSGDRVVAHVPACGNISRSPDGVTYTARAAGFGAAAQLHIVSDSNSSGVAPPNLPPALAALMAAWGPSTAVSLGGGAVALSASGALPKEEDTSTIARQSRKALVRGVAEVHAIVAEQSRRLVAALDEKYPRSQVGRMRDAAEAMRTVIGWNTVWDQRVKVMTPVSRTFGVNPFIMWDWDTYFLSLMAAEHDEALAYSNVLTVTRGRTIRGQVPNAECAQWTNDDRSEPYVGAMVVREIWRKFGDVRVVQLLFDDLMSWNTWVVSRRVLAPAGLVSVGSDPVTTPPHDSHSKQAAIWETGMDNSPMYDQVTWNATANKMLIYDVGMTGEFLGECAALEEMAEALNRSADAATLRARRERVAAAAQRTLWNAARGLYLNFQLDTNASNTHSSPTSFYPMLSGTATPEQALEMVRRWLTNHSGYCLNTSATPAPAPAPQPGPTPVPTPAWGGNSTFLSTRWSPTFLDNTICVSTPACRNATTSAIATSVAAAAAFGTRDTHGADAKQRSAGAGAAAAQLRKEAAHSECCAPAVWDDGQASTSSYIWMRPEGFAAQLPGAQELAAHAAAGGATVSLRLFYSADNTDTFLGTNTSREGYVVVGGISAPTEGQEPARLGDVAAVIFATPPNASLHGPLGADDYVPLDVYWSEARKDYQTVANNVTRKWLDGYEFVQRLGWVRATPPCTTDKPGCYTPPHSRLSPCRFALPSTPNDDPAYGDNSYWRGRVWGPLNLLVYLGLRHPRYENLPEIAAARKALAISSREALMIEWLPKHHVHENLNPDTGLGDDVGNSNPMYHWGALLGFLEIMEAGKF